jgi:iron complex transport system substrate-binding protein
LAASAPAGAFQDGTSEAARAVSVALCADAYVLALGGPEEIVALSWQVDQPVSAAPAWARALPRAWAAPERLLQLEGELFVFGPGEDAVAARLRRSGRNVHALAWSEDFAGVEANLRALGEAWGRAEAADAAMAALQDRIAELARRAALRGERPRIAYMSASGASAGTGTFIDAAIRLAGGRNAASEAGLTGWGRSDAEFALRLEAELVITGFFTDGFVGVANDGARHAAYRRLFEGAARLDLRSADLVCAGPRLVDAAEAIADALDALAEEGR